MVQWERRKKWAVQQGGVQCKGGRLNKTGAKRETTGEWMNRKEHEKRRRNETKHVSKKNRREMQEEINES